MNKKSHFKRNVFLGLGIAAAIALAACAAPVDVDLDVGKSVTVAYKAGEGTPDPKAVVDAVQSAGPFEDVNVRVRRQNDDITVQLEVWGENAGKAQIGEKLKQSVPALAAATITEKSLSGKVESTLGKKLGHDLFDMDIASEKDVGALREKILADLAAQGVEGQVDVKVEDEGDGKRKVKIEVRQEGPDCEPPTEEQKKSGP